MCAGPENPTIYTFKYPSEGIFPLGPLTADAAGNLYGTTNIYGTTEYGVGSGSVYELSPTSTGTYTEKVLYTFTGGSGGTDGSFPNGVILDAAGNLYGTTTNGGAYNQGGTVWELSPNGSGGWREKILYSLGNGNDGQYPRSALLLDRSGNLFGTTSNGGTYNYGIVFELSPSAGGSWTESVLHSFGGLGMAAAGMHR